MKQIKYFFIALMSLLALSSCEDWLDISPKNRIKSKDLFTTEAGFRDALFGVYTTMGGMGAYGGNGTFLTMDLIAQVYTQVGYTFAPLYNLAYASDPNAATKRTYIDLLWSRNYYAIANCNDILSHIDNDKSIFSEGIYEIIKAETMALRAFLHFDMLRAYGPVPVGGNMDMPAIPLMKELTNTPVRQSSVNEVVDFVLKELDEARKTIAPVDPIGPNFDTYIEEAYYQDNPVDHYEYADDDGFTMYRRSRFNYYGITAAMARVALWGGKNTDALKYAQEVINSGKFPMATETQGAGASGTFMAYLRGNEYITSLYYNHPDKNIYEVYFNSDNSTNNNYMALHFRESGLIDLFGADRDFDWRFKHTIAMNNVGYYCLMTYSAGMRIPLLKISEMYLICAEVSGNIEYLNELRNHRGFVNYQLPADTDMEEAIKQEYRKEFMGEGQLFYYYKRKNLAEFPNGKTAGKSVYVLPLPDMEIEYGHIETEE